jgi:hypothetical protein
MIVNTKTNSSFIKSKYTSRFSIEGINYTCDSIETIKHFYPSWMPFKLHLILEDVLETFAFLSETPLYGIYYDVLHGLFCSYTPREITLYLINHKTAPHHKYF